LKLRVGYCISNFVLGALFAASSVLDGCSASRGLTPAPSSAGSLGAIRAHSGNSAFTVVHYFTGAPDGQEPYGGLAVDGSGDLFGTTYGGGEDGGTVFELKPSSGAYAESVIYAFQSGYDGIMPLSTPLVDDGRLYVTTSAGGKFYDGTAIELRAAAGSYGEAELYSFGSGTDGQTPEAGYVRVGTTLYATSSSGGKYGNGAIVALTVSGLKETDVYDFRASSDGANPSSTLVVDTSGALYGTTAYGGKSGFGTVFKFVPASKGGKETVLWNFGGADGANPSAGLVRVASGELYGTTLRGGPAAQGSVFKLAVVGGKYKLTTLHDFAGAPDGLLPSGGLTLDRNVLYGTTDQGGGFTCSYLAGGCGTIFKIGLAGTGYAVVHSFAGSDGAFPNATLLYHSPKLYGTTVFGGTGEALGTVFSFDPS
jgi:uncharacterized repeat protein (TIGR03803 family)